MRLDQNHGLICASMQRFVLRSDGLDDAVPRIVRLTHSESRLLMQYPVTPDGRYFVVRGRLWRCSNPALATEKRQRLTRELMKARRGVRDAGRAGDQDAMREARRRVHEAKVSLGERGAVWWNDGAPDFNRYLVKNTPYASWFSEVMRRAAEIHENDAD